MNKNLTPEQKKAIELYKKLTESTKKDINSLFVGNGLQKWIEDIESQRQIEFLEEIFGKELFVEQKDIRERVKTWEDACKQLEGTEFLKKCNNSICDIISCLGDSKNKHLKSVLAYCKLLVIVEALNEGWKADCFDNSKKFQVSYNLQSIEGDYDFVVNIITYDKDNNLVLKSEELAQHLVDNFSDLLKDYFMID